MIEELMKVKAEVALVESSVEMAEPSTPQFASNCRRFLLTKLNKKVEEIEEAMFGIMRTQHAIFEATSSGKAYFAFIRGNKCIIKSSQEWSLSRTNLSPVEEDIIFKQFNDWQDKLEKEWHYMFDKFAV
uniref:Uncharacterized protein n=1 Tax=viral metagenome TaxID=1070528 RepID=A0A6C0B3P5_9ZZZZ